MLQPDQLANNGKTALIALGSNVTTSRGDARETVRQALDALDAAPLSLVARSRLYRTPAFPPGAGPDFVNAAAAVTTALSPAELLAHLHEVEAAFGRTRHKRWASRTLDLDLIAMGELVLPDAATLRHWMELPLTTQMEVAPESLVLPHPRLAERAFVLVPLADVAPGWRHPLTGASVAEMLAARPASERAEVVAVEG